MTTDNDPDYFNPTSPRKSYNPFESDEETLDTPGMESGSVYTKEDHLGFDLREFEKGANPLTYLIDNDDSLWEEAIHNQPALITSADDQPYTDKNVTECELPDPLISKDIGVDEGARTHESKDPSSFLGLSRKGDAAMNVEKISHNLDVEASKPKLSSDTQKDAALYPNKDPCVDGINQDVQSGQCMVHGFLEDRGSFPVAWSTMTIQTSSGGLAYDGVDNHPVAEMDPSNNASKQGEPDSVGKDGNDNSPDKVENIVVQEPATGETPSKLSTKHDETNAKPDESQNEEQTLPDLDNMACSSKPDPGSITFGFNSSTHSNPQIAEAANPPSTQSTTRREKTTSSNSVHMPSSITFSGPVAYSGSVSIRSESSTGSTRSFAFPV